MSLYEQFREAADAVADAVTDKGIEAFNAADRRMKALSDPALIDYEEAAVRQYVHVTEPYVGYTFEHDGQTYGNYALMNVEDIDQGVRAVFQQNAADVHAKLECYEPHRLTLRWETLSTPLPAAVNA